MNKFGGDAQINADAERITVKPEIGAPASNLPHSDEFVDRAIEILAQIRHQNALLLELVKTTTRKQ